MFWALFLSYICLRRFRVWNYNQVIIKLFFVTGIGLNLFIDYIVYFILFHSCVCFNCFSLLCSIVGDIVDAFLLDFGNPLRSEWSLDNRGQIDWLRCFPSVTTSLVSSSFMIFFYKSNISNFKDIITHIEKWHEAFVIFNEIG